MVSNFILPKSDWWEYYNPIIERLNALKEIAKGDEIKTLVLQEEENEIDLYRKYSDYFSYAFFVLRKNQ